MDSSFIEASYPIGFRKADATALGEHLRHRHSVEIIGMTRVGISNFLRFFLYHKEVVSTYINHGEQHVFIPVDLNDLIERDVFPFWILTFKRLVDKIESLSLPQKTKKEIASLFLESIQLRDMFITIESLRKTLKILVQNNIQPTIFFLRFDRLKEIVNPELFSNLQGLKDATGQKLSYVFTSFRSLDALAPHVFNRTSLSVFSHLMYIKPASREDMEIIFDTFESKYHIAPDEKILDKILELCVGHVQYLQLALILLNEKLKNQVLALSEIESSILYDERIILQSEEIWESLTEAEQTILTKVLNGQTITPDEKKGGKYIWETGIVQDASQTTQIFSPILAHHLSLKGPKKSLDEAVDLTKKEHALFTLLKDNLGHVCERERIISQVWPEYEAIGVSDWTVDRLVARLRTKLKKQKNKYSIVTVKTRGFKLMEEIR